MYQLKHTGTVIDIWHQYPINKIYKNQKQLISEIFIIWDKRKKTKKNYTILQKVSG